MAELTLLTPDWPAPAEVVAISSTRQGGLSLPPFDGLNMGQHVGDQPSAVAENRRQLLLACPGLQSIHWLNQVHGTTVVDATGDSQPDADACYSTTAGIGCAVMTADCLPLLICDRLGGQVAAVHAGWRGLAAGVVEATVEQFAADPEQLLVWLGPAISPLNFEVGAEVREQFLRTSAALQRPACEAAFVEAGQPGQYYADIYQLARLRLQALGVEAVYGGSRCTYGERQYFFSYRRDGSCGRMASVIYIRQ